MANTKNILTTHDVSVLDNRMTDCGRRNFPFSTFDFLRPERLVQDDIQILCTKINLLQTEFPRNVNELDSILGLIAYSSGESPAHSQL